MTTGTRSSPTALDDNKIGRGNFGGNEISDSKSAASHRSGRSSVLERAREYNKRIDERNRQRAKSLERGDDAASQASSSHTPRSQSAGRSSSANGNRISTRERAMASVRKESGMATGVSPTGFRPQSAPLGRSTNATPTNGYVPSSASASARPDPTPVKTDHSVGRSATATPKGEVLTKNARQQSQTVKRPDPTTPKSSSSRARSVKSSSKPSNSGDPQKNQEAVVTPELLVDALSGHEDGLLAIAERLMEHYDAGYDVMGEAIIDAFADVQKLFQHVVEAAHMEGAAFEAQRREGEMAELRKQIQQGGGSGNGAEEDVLLPGPAAASSSTPNRHDEFIDQDVKDILTEAIRKGITLREELKHMECYKLYEGACQNASSLLPVDSDHRGRLQLSIARAESMSPDRACAILRYAMDDVLRSGLRAVKAPQTDVSKRGDCVLSKPKDYPSMNGSVQAGVVQSSEEALASLVEEMKEVLGAPVYDNTPLQTVADRFWVALGEAQKAQLKTEERLEQSLGKLKGDFLLARAEWEEKLNAAQDQAEQYKKKYMANRDGSSASGEIYMEQARAAMKMKETRDPNDDSVNFTFDSPHKGGRGPGSVASLGDGLAKHARSIVGSFNCVGANNERTGVIVESEMEDKVLLSKQSTAVMSSPLPPHREVLTSKPSMTSALSTPNSQRDALRKNRSFNSHQTTTTSTPTSRSSSRSKRSNSRASSRRDIAASQAQHLPPQQADI